MKGPALTTKTILILLAAVILIAAGILNLIQRLTLTPPPTDGVRWSQTKNGVVARAVGFQSAGERAGILPADRLIAISSDGSKNYEEVISASDVPIYLEHAGLSGQLSYLIERPSFPEETRYYYADLYSLDPQPTITLRSLLINITGIVYLLVGLFILFKQGANAPFVGHFSVLCLTAFAFHFYRPIGAYRDFDIAIAFLDDISFALFVPIFVHFCATYPSHLKLSNKRWWLAPTLYIPAIMLALAIALADFIPTSILDLSVNVIGWLNRLLYVQFTLGLLAGAVLLVRRFYMSETPVIRQQLKWVVWGSLIALTPLTFTYSIGYLLGYDLSAETARLSITGSGLIDASILPMVLIPLTFGNSILRYRLMDVDMMVRRTAVYALTSITIAVLIGFVVYIAGLYTLGSGGNTSSTYEANALRVVLVIAAMTAVVMAAAPIKNFLQERTDRLFYGERYDLRNSLLDFGRTLSGTTTIDRLIESLIDRLQQVLNVARIAIFIQDPSTPSGYRVAGMRGLSIDLVVPPDFRDMIRVRSAATGVVRADDIDISTDIDGFVRRPIHYYVPCVTRDQMVAIIGLGRTPDGSLLSSEDLEVLLYTVSGYIAVAIENSLLYEKEQKHAAQMEMLKEFNESIIESINVGLLAADLDGRITSCNSALEAIFEINREQVIGRHFEDLFVEGFAVSIRNAMGGDYLHETALKHVYKLRTSSAQNRPLIVNIALAPLRDDSGNRTGSLIVIEDVTTRVQFEEQLQQREKLSSIGLLAAGVAHEINTPLTGVSSYTQMLLGMLAESDPKHKLLEKINHQADRAADIVGNLLNFARTGSTSQFGTVNINRILDDTLQLLESQLRQGCVEVVREYAQELPEIPGSAGKLQQVFTNLILNARDAVDGGGRITLKTYRNGYDMILISVSDTGIGIAPENTAKIYDPFFTTKEVGRGTGLGLAVSYGIIQEHSGSIQVESQPGSGTTFVVALPIEATAPQPEIRLHAHVGARNGFGT